MTLDADVKGDAYEGLLAKNAEDVKSGAGQYFTPRPLIKAVVEVMGPTASMRVSDPAAGTGGFLLAAYERMKAAQLDPDEKRFLRDEPPNRIVVPSGLTRGPSAVGSYPPSASRGHGPFSPKPRSSHDHVVLPPQLRRAALLRAEPAREVTPPEVLQEQPDVPACAR
jgi:type I restriction enzyme M protein